MINKSNELLIKTKFYLKTAKRVLSVLCLKLTLCGTFSGYMHAGDEFKIAIMKDRKGCAAKFRPLINYFSKHGINLSFITARNYPYAAAMFSIVHSIPE
jgi:hypothetical protein